MRRSLPTQRSPLGLLVYLGLIVGLAVLLWRGYGIWSGSRFGRFDRFNLVIGPRPVALVSLDLADKSAVVVSFPDDLYLTDVVHGYGQYKIAAVYSVGQLDKRGGETLSRTVSEYVGIPVDGYVISGSSYSSVKGLLLNPKSLLAAESSLGKLDLFRLALEFIRLRVDKVKEVDLTKIATPLVLADGTVARSIDSEALDNNLTGSFREKRLRGENLRVEVINSTAVFGLANRAARQLSNIGINVVFLGTRNLSLASCQVLSLKKSLSALTVLRIAQAFSCQVVGRETEGSADVTVILGQDYVRELGK